MTKNDNRIDIRISTEDKKIMINYCNKNNIKLSNLLRECALNYIKEKELKEEK